MRKIALLVVVSFALLPVAGFTQQAAPGMAGTSPPTATGAASPTAPGTGGIPRDVAPQAGGPLYPDTETGLDKVASDGVSTKTVKAAPCSAAARETDGFTTCVGIPSGPGAKQR
jgi:hypothetical protein